MAFNGQRRTRNFTPKVPEVITLAEVKDKHDEAVEKGKDTAWVSVEVVVTDSMKIPDKALDSMKQKLAIADSTADMELISWLTSNLPMLEVGKRYRLKSVTTGYFENQYMKRYSLKMNSKTQIEEISP